MPFFLPLRFNLLSIVAFGYGQICSGEINVDGVLFKSVWVSRAELETIKLLLWRVCIIRLGVEETDPLSLSVRELTVEVVGVRLWVKNVSCVWKVCSSISVTSVTIVGAN